MKKRLISCLLILVVLGGVFAVPALAVLPETVNDHVIDVAGVLSAGVRNDVNNLGAMMLETINAEILVVAVEYIDDGQDAEQMAFSLADRWQVETRGMLLLFSTQERRCWLAIGEEIVGSWPDSRVEAYMEDYFYADLDRGNFDAAVISLVHALALWYENYYGVLLVSDAGPPVQAAPEQGGGTEGAPVNTGALLLMAAVLVVGVILLISLLGRRNRRPRGPMEGPMGGPMGPVPRRRRSWFWPMMFFWGMGRRPEAAERRRVRWRYRGWTSRRRLFWRRWIRRTQQTRRLFWQRFLWRGQPWLLRRRQPRFLRRRQPWRRRSDGRRWRTEMTIDN